MARLDDIAKWADDFAGVTGQSASKVRAAIDKMGVTSVDDLDPQAVYSQLGGGRLYGPPKEYVPPAPKPEPEGVPLPGPRPREEVLRLSVEEELPFLSGAPDQQIEDASRMLGPTTGADALIARLFEQQLAGGRPLYSMDTGAPPRIDFGADVLPDPTIRMQADTGSGWGAGWEGAIPDSSRSLTPYGTGGPGVPVGGPRGSGTVVPESRELSTSVRPRPALEGPVPRRIETTAPGPVVRRLEAPGVAEERAAMKALEDAVNADGGRLNPSRMRRGPQGQPTPPRQPAGGAEFGVPERRPLPPGEPRAVGRADVLSRRRRAAGIGAGVLVGAAGARLAMEPNQLGDGEAEMMDGSMDTADLAAEQTPPPQVEVREEPLMDYSAMAREKIRQANVIQRRTGKVTPESAALSREADALYLRAAEERAAGRGQPIMPSEQSDAQTSAVRAEGQRQISGNPGEDYHSQARRLMGRMNSGEFRSPADYSAAQREVNRLFALGDSQRRSSGRR